MARMLPKEERAKLMESMGGSGLLLDYLERQDEIEAAAKTLEGHRAEFKRLTEDEAAYLRRAEALFAEERFRPIRFTAADVRRAFDEVGIPLASASSDQMLETFRAAILHLADKSRRSEFAMKLAMHLPDYVAEGRFLDAWIIQQCSFLIQESSEESNVFLFEMFRFGYDAWVSEREAHNAAALRDLGMDPDRLRGMSIEEIDAWLAQQGTDPADRARLEAIFQNHPEYRAQAIANLERTECDSIKLLEREDARHLLLTPVEWVPHASRLTECLQRVQAQFPDPARLDADPAGREAAGKEVLSAIGDVAGAIFTAERMRKLVSQLRAYRKERFDGGDKATAMLAHGAMISVERETEPALNRFLMALCFESLRNLGSEAGPKISAAAE